MENAHMKINITKEQLEAWRRGELLIEFSLDDPPTVNLQDFERWVQERKIKPNLNNYSTYNCNWDAACPTWHVKALGVEDLPSIEEINEPRCIK